MHLNPTANQAARIYRLQKFFSARQNLIVPIVEGIGMELLDKILTTIYPIISVGSHSNGVVTSGTEDSWIRNKNETRVERPMVAGRNEPRRKPAMSPNSSASLNKRFQYLYSFRDFFSYYSPPGSIRSFGTEVDYEEGPRVEGETGLHALRQTF